MKTLRHAFAAFHRHRVRWLAAAAALAAVAGCADLQPARAVRIGTGAASQTICSGVFVSGRGADETYRDEIRPETGMGLLDWGLHTEVDPTRHEVTTSFAGLFTQRAVYREGFGCLLLRGEPPPALPAADAVAPAGVAADIAGPGPVAAQNAQLRDAIDAAFAEPTTASTRRLTQAVVVVHHGRVIAERYAPGIAIDTPLSGHSISKSVAHALIGVLVREGRLSLRQPVPIAAWQQPGDPRASVTIDDLLRNASGLPWDETSGGFDAATRMWFLARDMAGFAEQAQLVAAPGTQWAYSNRGWLLLSRIIRDAAGGTPRDVQRFTQRELFAPLGMRHVEVQVDATGTPVLSSQVFASARDWARFGLLYLHDGVVDGRRILPEGWARAAATPTLDAGYGAGFWLNNTATRNPWGGRWGLPGAPADAFFGRGYLGQFVVVVPSEDLVVVRLGVTHWPGGDIAGVGKLVGQVVQALHDAPDKSL